MSIHNENKELDSLLLRAYNLGWNNCLAGDDISSIDELSDAQILEAIKNSQPQKIRSSEWERAVSNQPVPLPAKLHQKYQAAIRFAGQKHANQKMPASNISYMVHISNVAMEVMLAYFEAPIFDIDFAIQVSLLHDVIEDTDTTADEVRELFGEKVMLAVVALTKDKTIKDKISRMNDSLTRIVRCEKEVGLVKLADRITNLQPPPALWSREKIDFYHSQAVNIYDRLKHCNTYLANRLKIAIATYSLYR